MRRSVKMVIGEILKLVREEYRTALTKAQSHFLYRVAGTIKCSRTYNRPSLARWR
jgi:hypothetical protein